MEKQKIFIKIAYVLIVVSVLVLIGLSIVQHQQIKKISENAATETVTKDESAGEATPGQIETFQEIYTQAPDTQGIEKRAYKDQIDELEYQLDAAEEELDMAQEQLSEELTKQAENAENMIELQKKMLQDPAYKNMLRNTYKGMIDSMYSSLYNKLDLAPEKEDELKELLLDQMMSSLDINQETLGVTPSEEKREELQQRITDLREENDGKIIALLGDDNFNTYEAYRDRIGERQVVTMFMESLSPDEKLTEEQQQDLIDSMYQERKNVYSQQEWDEERVTFSSEYDDEGIAKIMDMTNRTHDGYVKGAGNILSESQQEQFKTYLKQQRDMTESALKMSSQMYGGRTTQENTEETPE
jgi:hypothetical protein